jgi:hypothetical protein
LTGAADVTEVIEAKAPEMLGISVGRFAEPDNLCGLALLLGSDAGATMTARGTSSPAVSRGRCDGTLSRVSSALLSVQR